MHYPGHDNWQGMSYGLLDETPTLTRTPSNPTVGDYLTEFQDLNRTWRESLKFPEFTPNSGRLDPEEEVEEPEDDPILGPVVRRRILPTPHEGDSQWEPMGPLDRNPANNWGWANPLERGILAGMLPGGSGHLVGSGNQWEAMQMGRTGWGKQHSPSFLDVATFGIFDSSGLYDKAVENMENWNIAGRGGFMGSSPVMDYTHQYGPNFMDDVKAYNPWAGVDMSDPESKATAEAVDNIAQAQANAVAASYGNNLDMFDPNTGDSIGMGGGYTESAAGEMDDDTSPGNVDAGYDDTMTDEGW